MFGLVPGLKTTLILGGIIALLAGSFYVYHRWTSAEMNVMRSEIAAQRQRADALEETQRALLADMDAVRRAQEAFNRTAAQARNRAADAARTVRDRDLHAAARADRARLEQEANTGTADAFRALEEVSRAR